jgi:hypothetical protein
LDTSYFPLLVLADWRMIRPSRKTITPASNTMALTLLLRPPTCPPVTGIPGEPGVPVGEPDLPVGETDVPVGELGVPVGELGVPVDGMGVSVGGMGVSVGGMGVSVGGMGVLVGVGVMPANAGTTPQAMDITTNRIPTPIALVAIRLGVTDDLPSFPDALKLSISNGSIGL